MLKIKNISKDYKLGKTTVHALRGVSLTIDEGEFLTIVGPSGSGKTTLLNIIGCLDKPTSGQVFLNKQDITQISEKEATLIRRHHIGFIFQGFNLVPVLTAFENVELPLILLKIDKKEREKRVLDLLEKVGIGAYKHHVPDELSGGQRQRVSIARSLITNPSLVLADEPTANLDHVTGKSMIKLMSEMNKTLGTTFIFSTHDKEIVKIARRKVVIEDGVISK